MSLINIIVLSFKFLIDCWDVFVYGRGWPHASQVCCDSGILITRVKCSPFMNQLYRSRELEETRDADSRIREVTKVVQPEIESRQNQFFGLFEALSYYTWTGWRDGEEGKFSGSRSGVMTESCMLKWNRS